VVAEVSKSCEHSAILHGWTRAGEKSRQLASGRISLDGSWQWTIRCCIPVPHVTSHWAQRKQTPVNYLTEYQLFKKKQFSLKMSAGWLGVHMSCMHNSNLNYKL